MDEYTISIELLSNSIIGQEGGWGSLIDNDVVVDEVGLPYFPARRLKGLLKDSSYEIMDMFKLSRIDLFDYEEVAKEVFGNSGDSRGGMVVFNNLYIHDYETILDWLKWGISEFPYIISQNLIINYFTDIYQQTAINKNGVADPHSLRTSRALKPGLVFEGSIFIKEYNPNIIKLLALSCLNLRHVGTMRHRGYGEVNCVLWLNGCNISEKTINQIRKEVIL